MVLWKACDGGREAHDVEEACDVGREACDVDGGGSEAYGVMEGSSPASQLQGRGPCPWCKGGGHSQAANLHAIME